MTTGSYLVACPELGEREIVYGSERAADICYSMHCESEGAYAFVEDWLGHTSWNTENLQLKLLCWCLH